MPPISNDLLLAAALTSALPGALAANPDANTPRTGVATTVSNTAARGATSNTVYIDGTTNQRLTTDANSTLHVLFSDQSALTIGPNSELMIARYEFDNKTKNGQILIDMTKGFLRVVGGLISKKNDVVVRTASSTIGIRGGISTVGVVQPGGGGQPGQPGGQTSATFLFGQQMTVTPPNGGPNQSITRPGFGITSSVVGLGPAVRVSTEALSRSQAPAPAPPPTVAGSPAPAPGPAPAPAPSGPASVQVTGLISSLSLTRLNDFNPVNTAALNTGGGGANPRPVNTFLRAVIGRPNALVS